MSFGLGVERACLWIRASQFRLVKPLLQLQGTYRLIQQQNPRLPHERSRNRDPLLLSTTQARLGDGRVKVAVEVPNKAAASLLGRGLDFGAGRLAAGLAIGNIFMDL